jgi:hypothetical protein
MFFFSPNNSFRMLHETDFSPLFDKLFVEEKQQEHFVQDIITESRANN